MRSCAGTAGSDGAVPPRRFLELCGSKEFPVPRFCCGAVRRVCSLRRIVVTEVHGLSVDAEFGLICAIPYVDRNSFEASPVVPSRAAVRLIVAVACFSNIVPAIIGFIQIAVIHLVFRPSASFVEPSKAAAVIDLPVYANLQAPIRPVPARIVSGLYPTVSINQPAPFARAREIPEHFSQSRGGELRFRFQL